MQKTTFLSCVYYYSLPEFPENCQIVENNSLFVRDVLVCNPKNPHVKYGGQYDPHYEYSPAPEFKMCWKETRRKIMSLIENNSCDKIYLLFRTKKVRLSSPSSQCISGYYDVDIDEVRIDPNYEEPVVYAKEARFVDSENAIDLSKFFVTYPNPRFPFSSETRGGIFTKHLMAWIKQLDKAENVIDDYVNMTEQLDRVFKYNEFCEGIYPICENCIRIDRCFLTKRILAKGKLYHQLPKNIANRINKHYKKLGIP